MLLGLIVGPTVVHAAERSAACSAIGGALATVSAVVDERTLRLADATEVRLAGLEELGAVGNLGGAETAAVQAKAALEQLILGKSAAIQPLSEDRYGRRVALVAAAGDERAPSLQEQLIARGQGLVAGRIGHPGCTSRFLEAERRARAARLGLWAGPHYLIREADRPDTLTGARGRFALVEGKVLSVNDRGATVYVNFGRRWSEDFTVTVAKRNVRNFTAAGLEPGRLAGRRVRIRGWVDERGGPWIEALRPEQIEFADGH
jgi:endonuclease YncB( thermonuclease family)